MKYARTVDSFSTTVRIVSFRCSFDGGSIVPESGPITAHKDHQAIAFIITTPSREDNPSRAVRGRGSDVSLD